MTESQRPNRPFLTYVGLVVLSAVLIVITAWRLFPPMASFQLILLLVAVILSENFRFSIEPYSVSLAFPLGVASAILCGPAASCVVAAVSSINIDELRQRKPAPIVLFNLGQMVLSTGLSACLYMWLGGRVLQVGVSSFRPLGVGDFPQILVPALAMSVTCVLGNMLLTAVGMALFTRQPLSSTASTMITFVPTQFTLAGLGFLVAQVLAISALALPLVLAPLAVARQLFLRYAGLKVAYVDTIRSLVGALEAKDPYTRGHSERVSTYAVALGRSCGMDSRDLERLEYAALLHDIGKLAVPSMVLTKPGRLEPEEMLQIREHPARGADMIRRIPPLRDLAQAVFQHHEWFDGTGYPLRQGSDELSLSARVLSIADSYDAMTTTRAYRPALSREDAIAELIRGAGSQFDAEIVRLFVECRFDAEDGAQSVLVEQAISTRTEPVRSS
ncbi:MAG: HD-GYP domain-containing protein [Coriobacteriia bacterium]|nr:HD-GYP domain-containing protein [Coriobacteriia bacterium]